MKNDIDFTKIFDGDKIIGVMNYNNMIPVDESLISEVDVRIYKNDDKATRAYKRLCTKELDWIQKNQDKIVKKANKLYTMIVSGNANYGLRKRCLDFKKLESVLANRKKTMQTD